MVGTPNHGIYGWLIGGLCDEAHPGQECFDMQHDSQFIISLNSGDETPGNINYLTIAGDCSDNPDNDGVVRVSSVSLNGAINKEVIGEKIPFKPTFHGDLVDPSKVPEVYNYVVDFLSL